MRVAAMTLGALLLVGCVPESSSEDADAETSDASSPDVEVDADAGPEADAAIEPDQGVAPDEGVDPDEGVELDEGLAPDGEVALDATPAPDVAVDAEIEPALADGKLLLSGDVNLVGSLTGDGPGVTDSGNQNFQVRTRAVWVRRAH